MPGLGVLPLDMAKRYLNIPAVKTENDAELSEDFIPPAVERVERHLGRALVDYASASASERLALKMVLAEYWQTQRVTMGRSSYGGGASGAAVDADRDPGGAARLTIRLTEILGPPAADGFPGPRGSFPPALAWPDPPRVG